MDGIKKLKKITVSLMVVLFGLVFAFTPGFTSDMCMFAVTADDLPPNIVILIDNGIEMKHPVTHGDYDNTVDYTPAVAPQTDVVVNNGTGNGFFNDNGYGIFTQGGK